MFQKCLLDRGGLTPGTKARILAGSRRHDWKLCSTHWLFVSAFAFGVLAAGASAQTQTLNIWPGVAPGSENWQQEETTKNDPEIGTVIWDVVTPTLTAYLPEKSKATGTSVIVVPGGACVLLAYDHEGINEARWLQERGIAAFVLKYRIPKMKNEGISAIAKMDDTCEPGIADAIQAIKVVREHAKEWGISPDRVGMMGFSAGGMVTAGTLVQADSAGRPNFAAPIYGGPYGEMPTFPEKLPPIFLAWAQDDDLAAGMMGRFYQALKAAGNVPEAHIYRAGGHGFGMKKQGTTSDHWLDEFYFWLEAQGLTKSDTK